MKKLLMTSLLFLLPRFMKGLNVNPQASLDVAQLKLSLIYIKSIKTARLLLMSLLGTGICIISLMAAIILFHIALFNYAPLSNDVKMYIGFGCSAMYLLIAYLTFSHFFSQAKWVEIFNAGGILDDIAKKASASQTEYSADNI